MALGTKYAPERAGDWGMPAPAVPDGYTTSHHTLADGTLLFFRAWQAPSPAAPVLVLLHGLGAHSGWFIDMGNELNARGLGVYAVDHRAFGRSDGIRGHVTDGHIYLRDIHSFLDMVRQREPGNAVSILGHSMGGIFATYIAADDSRSGRNQLAGVILLNPWVADTTKVSLGMTARIVAGGLRKSPHIARVTGGTESMTVNPEATRMLDADPYWVRAESESFLWQITLLRLGIMRQARDVRARALVIQAAEDKAVVPAATRRYYNALGAKEKTWKWLPGYAHDSELEQDRTALDDCIAEWLRMPSV